MEDFGHADLDLSDYNRGDDGCFIKLVGIGILGFALWCAISFWGEYRNGMIETDQVWLYIASLLPMIIGIVSIIIYLCKKKKERDFGSLVLKSIIIYFVCLAAYMISIEVIWNCINN